MTKDADFVFNEQKTIPVVKITDFPRDVATLREMLEELNMSCLNDLDAVSDDFFDRILKHVQDRYMVHLGMAKRISTPRPDCVVHNEPV